MTMKIVEENQDSFLKDLNQLRVENKFLDVTLTCDDGVILAHKVVIAAKSNYLKEALENNPNNVSTIVHLMGFKIHELNYIIEFMYTGEVTILSEELDSLLHVAYNLKVRGFSAEVDLKEDTITTGDSEETQVEVKGGEHGLWPPHPCSPLGVDPLDEVFQDDGMVGDLSQFEVGGSVCKNCPTHPFLSPGIC